MRNGLNVSPEDQSLWYYHQFLILNLVEYGAHQSIVPQLTADERISYIAREITDIKELLEDYTDIKWIYDALIEYSLAIGQLGGRKLDGEESAEVVDWLRKLKELDPKRNGRWNDWDTELSHALKEASH